MAQNSLFPREILQKLEKYKDRPEIYAIIGPRQAGKTTLLRLFQERLQSAGVPESAIKFFSFENLNTTRDFLADPERFIKTYTSSLHPENRFYILMDEVQYLDKSGRIFKLLFDASSNIKFVLTGSSSLEVRSAMGAFLTGRVFYFHVWPLSFAEFLEAKECEALHVYKEVRYALYNFLLSDSQFVPSAVLFADQIKDFFIEFMKYGGYPEVAKGEDPETKKEILNNIYATYVQKDVLSLLKITDTEAYHTLVHLLAYQIGGLINYHAITRDAGSAYTALKQYFTALEETFVIERLRPFHRNLSTELRKNPVVYFTDIGLRNFMMNNFEEVDKRADKGALAENFVFSELRKRLPDPLRLNYWRTTGKAEVDFVIRNGEDVVPIEVKYTPFDACVVSRSFMSFLKAYRPKKAVVITKNFIGARTIDETTVAFVPIWFV